ncbi:MAG: hypothetical protein AB7K04_13485 [Pseudorhodoplanes sp.]
MSATHVTPSPAQGRKPFRCLAWAVVSGRFRSCRLLDLSETSAGLTFEQDDPLPASFMLHLVHAGQIAIPCHLVRQDGRQVEVVFFDPPPASDPDASRPARLEISI